MSVPSQVVDLVERFQRNRDVYTRPDYKEARARVEFIDPFFEALGWDVRNVKGYAEQYKDVVHEDALTVAGAARAPDYCFRVGGVRKFFVEAKKPAISVHGDVGPAYQLRRYAWSAKLPLSILTDFEEFAVYDCRIRPKPADKSAAARILYLTFDEYLQHFDEVYDVFARESVLKGSFDRYVEDTKGKRGTSEVDAEFLKEIEGWRDALARNLALRNPALTVQELNFAVQRTIDRIIFLRMAEDRGIEAYGRLLALTNGGRIYERMGDLYRQADEKYNSGLFDFRADTLTRGLTHRRQGAEADPGLPVLPAEPIRVLGAAGGGPGPGVRAVPGQGDPADARAPGRGRGKAGGQEGGGRLLHALVHRGLYRGADGGGAGGGQVAAAVAGDAGQAAAAGAGPGVRVGVVPAGGVPVPAGPLPELVRGERPGEARGGQGAGGLPGAGRATGG